MLIEKRLAEIIRLVEEKKSVTVLELVQALGSSESTIRRDLTELDRRGKVKKVHGGATALEMQTGVTARDAELKTRYQMNREAKIKIAKYAASLIGPDDFVFMDAGSTTELMVDYITDKHAVFVTNGIEQGRKLIQKGCRTYVLGGELKGVTLAIVGEEPVETLNKYNFTKGFWGTNGISIEHGYSTPELSESMVKRKAIEQCREPYILADPTKFNQVSPITFADFEKACVITTKITAKEYMECRNVIEIEKES